MFRGFSSANCFCYLEFEWFYLTDNYINQYEKKLDGLLKLFNQRHVTKNWTIYNVLGGSEASLTRYYIIITNLVFWIVKIHELKENKKKTWNNVISFPFHKQKQLFADVLQNRCLWKFPNIHRKSHVSESLFNKVTALRPATLLKKWLQHRCFPVNFATFLRTPFL